ncbi:hypothetical protein A1O7_01827 [Cladophialophora yegresii CBS 114405]|uniref:Uncharacterized protein n=1 Tax=Cladophialophora yegresii CBS 114405 TaxID=1182544 RepID=W9WLJ4_9EURO|nr:uncharacterized protein A1O7_01827 [Cladophialophora yegresii CBS 114405]EXJ65486.1 hypothetical protein A1O7_01827 [Cladophialophora yegresii CBS 114405]
MSSTRYITVGAVTLGALLYIWPKASPGVPGAPTAGMGLKTTGMENVEKAYGRGGATSTHTKAYGGTVQGQTNDGPTREGASSGNPNAYEQEGLGDDQRAYQPTKPERAWNKTMYGSEKGK